MRLTRGLVVGSMLGMAAAMMMNNQDKGNNTSYSSDMSQTANKSRSQNINSINNYDNPNTNDSDLIITDIIR